jgi:hypothetical protein
MASGWTVGRKIGVVFGVTFLVLLATGLAGVFATRSLFRIGID